MRLVARAALVLNQRRMGKPTDIRTIGAALFWMLEQMLGDDFTPDVYAAWMTVFVSLSNDLRTAATRELAMVG